MEEVKMNTITISFLMAVVILRNVLNIKKLKEEVNELKWKVDGPSDEVIECLAYERKILNRMNELKWKVDGPSDEVIKCLDYERKILNRMNESVDKKEEK